MQNVSSSYLEKIKEPSRSFECKVTIGNNVYTNIDIINISIEDVQPSDGFTIGAAVSKSLELTLSTNNTIYSNSKVKLEIGLNIGSTFEYILIGHFHIEDIISTDYSTKLTCYDNMIKFEKPYFSNLGKTSSLKNIVNELATITGVEFTGSLPSYNLNNLEGFTCREILGFVASICGGNAYITREGKFTIKTPATIDYSITSDNYIDLKSEEDLYKVGAITCKVNDKELTKGTLSNSSMEITFENPWVTESILTDIYNKLKGFEFIGYSMKWQGDFSLDLGDIISITDTKGNTRQVPIFSQKLTYNGGLTSEIGAKGESKTKNEFSPTGDLNNKVNRVVTDLLIVNKALINKADVEDLKAVNAEMDNLIAVNVTITGKLNAIEGEFGTLKANVGVIDKLTVTHTAQINDLKSNSATITDLKAVNASITNLQANVAKIGILEADVGKINTLLAGNLTSTNIQAGGITSDKLTIANGFITNAMIANLDVAKINAGNISTNKFKIKSDDGGIEIVGATQQFKDKNNRVRIQMGQDAKGNFNFIIRGEDGTTTLIDHTGIKEKAIADDLIKETMIAQDAIGEKQINYSSFITGFNKDTNTNTIKSTKIMLNNQNQTLDVAFSSLKTQADDTKSLTESHSTTIGVMQGQITTAINNTKIVKNGQTILLKDDYNRTVQTIDSMKSTIGSHTTQINGLDSKVSTQESSISQLKNQIALKVEKSDITEAINGIQISSENLFRYSDFSKEGVLNKWYRYNATNHTLSVGVYSSFGNNLSEDAHIKNQKILRSRIDIDQAIKDGVDYGGFNIATNERGVTLEANTEYTFSYWVYKSGNCKSTHATIWTNVTEGSVSVGRTESVTKYTGSFVKQSVTFTTKDITDYYIRFYNYIDTSKVGGFSDVHIYQPLLTKGNKVVGWSPSVSDIEGFIEDVDSKVTTVSSQVSQLNVSVGKINGEVSSLESTTQTISGKVDTAQKTADTATAKANSAQSTANTANSTANTNKGNISTLTTEMTSTKSKVSALEISMGNITTRVSDVETLSITNFNNLLINSNIKESVVGWRLTNLAEGTSLNRAITSASIPDRHCIFIGKLSDNTSQTRYMDSTKFIVTKGEKISLSLHALTGEYVDKVQVYILFTNNTKPIEEDNSYLEGYESITIPSNTGWKKYTLTSTCPSDATRGFIRIRYVSKSKPNDTSNNRASLASIMVNRGESYPTWTSNTEDYFNYHESRLSIAESKITETAITNTVKKNFYTKSETDKQITSKGYQTASQVQQTVNALEVKFSESGGYNLLYNGDFKRGTEKWSTTSGFTYTVGSGTWSSPDRKGVRITGKTGESGFLTQYITTSNLINGSKYTLSGYVYISSSGTNDTDGGGFRLYSRVTYTDDTKEYFYTNINKTLYDKWQKVSITFNRDSSKTVKEISASVSISKTTKYIYVSQIMLETGGTVTNWSPNPNETYDGITTIDKDGITVTSSNVKSKTTMSANGFKITKTDTNTDVFKVNSDGRLSLIGDFTSYTGNRKSGYFGSDQVKFYNWWADTNEEIAYFYGGKTSDNKRSADIVGRDMFSIGVGTPTSGSKVLEGSSSKLFIYKNTDFGNYKISNLNGINEGTSKDIWLGNTFLRSNQLNTNMESGILNLNFWKGYNSTGSVEVKVGNGNNDSARGTLTCQNFKAYGTKNACVQTSVGYVDINAYETCDYYFGDIGETILDNEGYSYVYIDSLFFETVNTQRKYQVFLSIYGEGTANVVKRTPIYFVIKGTPGIEVGYEIKAKRKGYEDYRLERDVNTWRKGEEHGLDEDYNNERIEFNRKIENIINEEVIKDIENKTLQEFISSEVERSIENIELMKTIEEDIFNENIN